MTRWLVWVCGGLVAAGIVVRLCWSGADQPAGRAPERRQASSPPTPATGTSPETSEELRQRLLSDDKLTPPRRDASPEVKQAYQEALDAILQGKDPVLTQTLVTAAMQKRVEERCQAARQRKEEVRSANEKRREERRAFHEKKRAEHEAAFGPRTEPRSKPSAAFTTPPVLGAPLEGVEPEEKK